MPKKSILKEPGGDLKANNSFQIQSWEKHVRQTLVFMSNKGLEKSSISIFQGFFGSIEEIIIAGKRINTRL